MANKFDKILGEYREGDIPTQAGNGGKFLTTDGANASWGNPVGSGDVIGPATNSADYIPQWNGNDSKTLKNGISVDSFAASGHNHNLNDLTEKSYNSLNDKPTIPTKSFIIAMAVTL